MRAPPFPFSSHRPSMDVPTITCPYNASHQIRPGRIQYHLVRCAKQHPGLDMFICPYNATHHVPRHQETSHLMNCDDRDIIEAQKFRLGESRPDHHHHRWENPVVYGSSLIPFEEPKPQSRPLYNPPRPVLGPEILCQMPATVELGDPNPTRVEPANNAQPETGPNAPAQPWVGFERGMGRGSRGRKARPTARPVFRNDLLGQELNSVAGGLGRGLTCLKTSQMQRAMACQRATEDPSEVTSANSEDFEDALETLSSGLGSPRQAVRSDLSVANLKLHDRRFTPGLGRF